MKERLFPAWPRRWVLVLALIVLYVSSARLGLILALPPEKKVTAVWPPSGIAFAAVLLFGPRVWPGIWLGAFFANLWDCFGPANPFSLAAHLGVSFGIAIGSTLQALLGTALLFRWVGSPRPLDRARDVFKFVGVAPLMCLVAATVGVTCLWLAGFAPPASAPFLWLTWWLGDTTGILVLTPLLLSWGPPARVSGGQRRLAEAGVFLGLLVTTSLLVFGGRSPWGSVPGPLPYLTVPLLVWAAFRFGRRGATATLLLLAAVAVWGTAHGSGPFVGETLNESLLLLQTFVAVLSVTALVVAAVLAERKRAEEAVTKYVERLRILHQIDRALIAGEGPAAIAAAALVPLRGLLGVPRAIVNLFDLAKGEVEWLAAAGRRRVHVGPGVRYSTRLMGDMGALRRGELQLIDVHALPPGPEVDALLASGVHAYVVVPMIAGDELIGALSFGGASMPLSAEQVSIAQEAASQFAIALAQARLHERVKRQAQELEVRVAERQRAEEALRDSERRYRELFEANPHPMWVYDAETLRFLAVNDAAVRRYGYSRSEFLAMTIKNIRPVEQAPALLAQLARPTFAFSEPSVWTHRTKGGELREVEVTSHQLEFGGRQARLVLANDVTDRLRSEASRRRLLAVLDATTDLVAITQVEGPAEYVNPAGRRLLGVGPEEAVSLLDHRPEAARQVILEEALPTALRDGAWGGETVLRNRAGEEIPVSQVLIAHKGASGAVEFLSTIARDVRGQKRLEAQYRQAQKMEAVGQLAGGVAHDFNNLLTVITGYGELLLDQVPDGDPGRELIRGMVEAGNRAAGLTRQLLAFSRKAILEPKILDLPELVSGVDRMLRRVLGEDIELTLVTDPSVGTIKADAGQVEQVLLNLVVNARDAMPRGGRLTVEVRNAELDETYTRTHPEARPGPHALLAVSDTGCGMDAATLARVFEPFFSTKGEKGTGLGLATVHGIVKQFGGHVAVYSEPGVGTTFKVYLPRSNERPVSARARGGPVEMPRGGETILLVEDEDGVRSLVCHVLRGCGYTVLESREGAEAVRLAEGHAGRIDLLMTDVILPRMGGREVADRVAARYPGVRVLFASGYTDDVVVRHGILESEVAFLQKPFRPASLATKVREVLDGR